MVKTRNQIRTETNQYYSSHITKWLREHVQQGSGEPQGFPLNLYLGAPTRDEDVAADKEAFKKFKERYNMERDIVIMSLPPNEFDKSMMNSGIRIF